MPPPIVERLKVRCYRCSQLLAVSANKAGTVVACPKCKAELLIPRQDGPQPADEPAGASGVAPRPSSDSYPSVRTIAEPTGEKGAPSSYLDEIAALIPPEVASLRPEDLRVEAEFFGKLSQEPPPRPAPAPAPPSPFDEPFTLPESLLAPEVPFSPPAPAPSEPVAGQSPMAAPAAETPAPAAPPESMPPPLPAAAAAPTGLLPDATTVIVPAISVEPAPIRPPVDTGSRPIREVVLPASVVLAWLVLVLMSLPMAFLAGLLLGHFVWKTGP